MGTRLWGGIFAGAGLMYFFDPDRGRRRRALLRDQVVRALDAAADAAETTGRDLGNRVRGLFAEARSLAAAEPVSDELLEARVRSRLGRVVAHPGAIEVTVRRGVVTLAGPIVKSEVDDLLASVSKIRGVREVGNRLEVHERAGHVPALQGTGRRRQPRFELAQENWSPTARLLAGAAGGGLAAYGAMKRGVRGTAAGLVGSGLIARAVSNMTLERLLGLGSGRRGIDVRKTIHVDAPVERVFDYWSEVSNFPLFLEHVKDVKDDGRGRSHWSVEGPAGTAIEFDAVITAFIPNQLIAWKTLPRQTVRHSGIVRFDEDPQGTRVDVWLTYKPPAGFIGHAVAALFGADPKHALDEDLLRFKSIIETGKTTAHGEEVVAVELPAEAPPTGDLASKTPGELAEPAPGETPRRSRRRSGAPPDRPAPRRPEPR
jgi:uncharacterized membrane protein